MTQTQARTSVVSMRELLEAGVHFGHQTRRWNPKMRRFIFGERNGIYVIDLRETMKAIEATYTYVRDLVADGGTIMFVSTKRQMMEAIEAAAERCAMPYVNFRWLGGMLTNFQTIHSRISYLRELETMEEDGSMAALPKKEALMLRRDRAKLERNLGGMKIIDRVPDAIFVIDTRKEHIAVTEARKKGVTIVATLDTNCDPDEVDFGIPANDDPIRAGVLMARIIADAVEEGRLLGVGRPRVVSREEPRGPDPEREAERRRAERDAARYEEQRLKAEAAEAASAQEILAHAVAEPVEPVEVVEVVESPEPPEAKASEPL